MDVYVIEYGGFLKYGYPKPLFLFIGNNIFSMILGYPHLWKPPSFYPGVFHWLVADEGWLLDHSFHILFFLEAAAADRHFGYLMVSVWTHVTNKNQDCRGDLTGFCMFLLF